VERLAPSHPAEQQRPILLYPHPERLYYPLTTRELARAIVEQAELAARGFYRLVVVAEPPGSGKTRALHQLRSEQGWCLLNLNKGLSERLLV
jgi:ATP/maltotriose-dependent transcriptional regulator MalT